MDQVDTAIDFGHTMAVAKNITLPIRALFYLVTPGESAPATLSEVPDLLTASFPYFIAMVVLELALCIIKGNKGYQGNDMITSIASGLISRTPDLFSKTAHIGAYMYVWNNWRLYDMPTDSAITWILGMLAFDLGFYCVHRAAHEINFLWAFHQTHHSSEYYNLSTALRQPILGRIAGIPFYLPVALFLPPSIFMVHGQLNLLYQFWIHTELVSTLGPLEYVLNTASHHRVHHGRNPYCIDKNYAGFLIIWDRLFGTFEPERPGEKIHYGLIHNIKTFDLVSVQFVTFYDIWRKFRANLRSTKSHGVEKMKNCFKAIVYGPGWFSRKPYARLGDPADLPPIEENPQRHDPHIPFSLSLYCTVHFLAVVLLHMLALADPNLKLPLSVTVTVACAEVFTIFSMGLIFNLNEYARRLEMLRCMAFLTLMKPVLVAIRASWLFYPLGVIFVASLILWTLTTDIQSHHCSVQDETISLENESKPVKSN